MRARGTTVRVRRDPTPGRQKPWGVFWVVYPAGRVGAKRKQLSAWFATEADALEFAAAFRAARATEAATAAASSSPAPAVLRRADSLAVLAGEHADVAQLAGWLAHARDNLEAATLRSYRGCVRNYLAPAPGHKRYPGLGDLVISDATATPKVFYDYFVALGAAGVSVSMRKRLQRATSTFCTWAKFAGKLTKVNPCFDLGKMIKPVDGEVVHEAKPNPFAPDEVTKIFDQLAAVEPDWALYFQFLLDVGVRIGEAAGLKWDAIDWTKRQATIARSYSPSSLRDKGTKTGRTRVVDLSTRLVERLEAWRADQRREAFRRGRPTPAYVFTTRRLSRMLPTSNMRAVFGRTMTACGIVDHTPHDFRDTFATSHLVRDWDRKLAWVSHQIGHSDPAVTAKFYYAYRPTRASASFADDIVDWGQS